MSIAPATKLKRGQEHYLNGKPVYVERDAGDGSVFISDSKERKPSDNFWWVNKSDLQQSVKFGYSISSKPKPSKPEDISDKKLLDAFFLEMGKMVSFNCQNCRKPLYALQKAQQRATTCHILPKSVFDELETDPDNILFMGVIVFGSSCNCHPIWDSSVEKRVKMAIYPYALKKYIEKMRPQLSEAKQQLADEYMGIITKSKNLYADISEGKI